MSKYGPAPIPLELRFWEKVDIVGDHDCWFWFGCKDKDGYGLIDNIRAHGLSLQLRLGRSIRAGFCVCHSCDNVACVNPNHLFEGTQLDNMRDMSAKGRRADTSGTHNNHSMLSEKDVLYIRTCGLPRRILAEKFNVNKVTICNIINRKLWRHI